MSSLIDIQNQIAELQARAAEIKAREINEKIAMIRETMAAYGITLEQLGKPIKEAKVKSSNPAPAKYMGPQGESWSGRGLMPKWLSTLVAAGHSKDGYLIKK
ncbi:MAG: H-NS histone family protein [Pseudomonadota bacterium]